MRKLSILRFSCGVWLALVIAGCAGYSNLINEPRYQFERGEYDLAIERLKRLVEEAGQDKLLFLLDLGMVYHTAGRYEEAILTFHQAEKIAEIKDYTSLSEEALTFLVNEEARTYRGEHFEILLINVYLAIDYCLLGKREAALIEARKVNHKLELMIRQGNLPYEYNAFAKYLAAVLFESDGEWNDALVDYRIIEKWKGEVPYLATPLLRLTDKMRMSQEFDIFKKKFPGTDDYKLGKKEGEIVLLLEQGRSPVKVPSEQFRFVPRFQRRSFSSDFVQISAGGRSAQSFPLYDIEKVAITELDHRIALLAAKRVGSMVAKEVIATKLEEETKSPLLGALTRLFFWASERADLRSWSTLPARLQIARLKVNAGLHRISLDMVDGLGNRTGSVKVWENIEVKPGRIVFLNYRTPD